jgi:phenylalanyl-tRNA synthetase beta chain
MHVPYSWLMEYLDADIEAAELAHVLTMGGLEVEQILDFTSADGEFHDQVLVTSVTSNRGDLLSMVGVARHAAALLGAEWQMPDIDIGLLGDPVTGRTEAANADMHIELANPQACPRYCGLVMDELTVAESPDWLGYRLEAAGMRPIANLVDCTNYVMLELGQPLHGFDYNLLKDAHIIVRSATDGEQVLTLDQQWRSMTAQDLLITDPAGPTAVAGVMGGADTEMTWETTKVLLESAHFDATTIRKTSLRTGLSSEAAYRFERIVDPAGTLRALARVAGLLLQTAGGRVIGEAVDACAADISPLQVSLRVDKCNTILGTEIPAEKMRDYLAALDFAVATDGDNTLAVTVPTFRPDVEREIDLIEEVAIVFGYENIPATVPGRLMQSGRLTPTQKLERRAREALRAAGLNETISHSFLAPADLDRMSYPEDAAERHMLPLASPVSEDQTHMRTTLLPALLQAAEHNQRHRVASVWLYEIGPAFFPRGEGELPTECLHAAGIISGPYWSGAWNMPDDRLLPDFFTAKGIIEQLVAVLGVHRVTYAASEHPAMHPGQCAAVLLADTQIGVIGKLSRRLQDRYDLETEAYVFEVDLDALFEGASLYSEYQPVPRFPAALRDIALVVNDTPQHTAEALREAICEAGGEQLAAAEVFDVYRDTQRLGEGKKQLAFRLSFRTPEGTLTDEQVDDLIATIVTHLSDKLGAELRS